MILNIYLGIPFMQAQEQSLKWAKDTTQLWIPSQEPSDMAAFV